MGTGPSVPVNSYITHVNVVLNFFEVGYLMTLSIPRLHDDRMNNECGVLRGMRIDGENKVLRENPPPWYVFHHKSHIT
jgi:hypothetical protein